MQLVDNMSLEQRSSLALLLFDILLRHSFDNVVALAENTLAMIGLHSDALAGLLHVYW